MKYYARPPHALCQYYGILVTGRDSMPHRPDRPDDSHGPTGNHGNTHSDSNLPWYIPPLVHVREEFLGKREGMKERLCQVVTAITQQRAWLIFLDHRSLPEILASLPPSTGTLSVSYDGGSFAILAFRQKAAEDNLPYLSLDDIKGIANTCGWVISSLGENAVRRARQKKKQPRSKPLSKRERQVLQLIDGSDEDIGQALNITTETVRKHKGRIRTKLGASDDAEARLIAFDRHLYFPLEGIISVPYEGDGLDLMRQHLTQH